MLSFYKLPWLSLGLVFLAYGVFGWTIANSMGIWTVGLIERAEAWGVFISTAIAHYIIYLLIILVILLVILLITIPLKSLNFLFGSWLTSSNKALVSILFWSFIFVLILSFLEYFVRILVILSASILGRLELQEFDYKNRQILIILFSICLVGFMTGYFAYVYLS
ncbi:hypothetical protein [Gloeocapsa sp. PCC 73106]|uniref:hypothetical protein n=1 Tax=Gloeocapsa sp. PCC 73106 TaxID=102232 RepID=UPI0002AC11D9|nr:hypothetical protein [Gloeocapsa sp. PCC 73106]ELR99250.1 hypothetical protein GLO73106DRAFT_00031000 [Gloeocapsa sp. PCC 73106]